jgi:hypothetical protein
MDTQFTCLLIEAEIDSLLCIVSQKSFLEVKNYDWVELAVAQMSSLGYDPPHEELRSRLRSKMGSACSV